MDAPELGSRGSCWRGRKPTTGPPLRRRPPKTNDGLFQLGTGHGGRLLGPVLANHHVLIGVERAPAGGAEHVGYAGDGVALRSLRQRERVPALLSAGQIAGNQIRRRWARVAAGGRPELRQGGSEVSELRKVHTLR